MTNQNKTQKKRTPWYLISELVMFIIPLIGLGMVIKKLNKPALFKALLIIVGLGYCWSMICSANDWWWFNPETMLGFELLPHLPLEEVLFYPLGGALCIMFYVWLSEKIKLRLPYERIWFFYIVLGLTIFWIIMSILSVIILKRMPYYLISQLILYNGLSMALWYFVKKRINITPFIMTSIIMTIIGFFWNWYAVVQKWWAYLEVLGWYWPANMPVDDWNFYFFATLAGTSLYLLFIPKEDD